MLLNLASQEYFKAVDRKALRPRVVECVFEDWKGGAWKIISFHAEARTRADGPPRHHAARAQSRQICWVLAPGAGLRCRRLQPDRWCSGASKSPTPANQAPEAIL